ncbi:hypothetical protein FOBRF1_007219 [Fusarium oxysporum]
MTTTHVGILRADGQARVQVGNNYYGSSDFLPTVHEAAFDSHAEEHKARCHRDTRTELLRQIREWANDPHGASIFWLNGMAGTGKSTISRTVAQVFADEGLLGASFFFKRGEGDRGKATLFFPTIASQLVGKIPALKPSVRKALDVDPAIVRKSLRDQFEKLILQPLGGVRHAMAVGIVVDALDECDGDNDVKAIISLLAQAKAPRSARLRIFITSRPELPIRLGFEDVQGKYQGLALHQMPEPVVERDISIFLRYKLARIRDKYNSQSRDRKLPPGWPGEHVIQILAQMAAPLFIFAATACRFIKDKGRSNPAKRLKYVLQYRTETHDSRLDKLDATYLPILNQLTFGRTDRDKAEFLAEFRDVVGPIVLLAQPLSVRSLAELLNVETDDIDDQLISLHSVLSIPPKIDAPVRLFHLSFRDFLVDPTKRAKEFWIDEIQYHKTLADRCIQLLHQHLKRDICGLQVPGKLRSEVDQQTIDAGLPSEVQYACQYWVHHLKESKGSVRDGGPVHSLLTSHLLHWLEALSLLGRISESIGMVDSLSSLFDATDSTRVSVFLRDIRRVIFNSRSIIDIAPLQVYSSAIIFTPGNSKVREAFKSELQGWVTGPAMEDAWSACLQTLEGHSCSVNSVAWSYDAARLASASDDNTVKIWDATTGQCISTLEGHSGSVNAAAWSHDAARLASASGDHTVKIWDPATGQCISTLEGHIYSVKSVAWSHDAARLATASDDNTVKIWDAATGQCISTLEGHKYWARSVTWSHDAAQLASASVDDTVTIWDAVTARCISTLKGHTHSVYSVAWSHDAAMLASASLDDTVKIWDVATGRCISTLEGHSYWARPVVWSHDSGRLGSASQDKTVKIWDATGVECIPTLKVPSGSVNLIAWPYNAARLASASIDNTVKIWDAATGKRISTLSGHTSAVISMAWSYDAARLASASVDNSVKIWDAATGRCISTLKSHTNSVNSITWSHDAARLASASVDNSVKIWDAATGRCISTLKSHTNSVISVAWSQDASRLASASHDKTVKIWDAATGRCISTLENHTESVYSVTWSRDAAMLKGYTHSAYSVAWSYDAARLAAASHNHTVKIWDAATGQCISTLKGHRGLVWLVAWSHDAARLASASHDKTVKIWNAATGRCISTLESHTDAVYSVAWSHDAARLASASWDSTVKIWDPATGRCVSTLKGHRGSAAYSVAWSHDAARLASASDDHTVKIWDPATGQCISTLQGQCISTLDDRTPWVRSLAWSHDTARLASAGKDKTIKIWDAATGRCISTLDIGQVIHHLQFDKFVSHRLHTDVGTFDVRPTTSFTVLAATSPSHSTSLPQRIGYGLSDNGTWITYEGQNLLWLSPEYRPLSSAVSGTVVAIGCPSGRVLILSQLRGGFSSESI